MAKPIIQNIRMDHGIEKILPWLDPNNRLRLLAKMAQMAKKLAVYLPGRQQRAAVESFIPRESHERERRLEFDRFMHW